MGKNNSNSWLNTVKKAFKSPTNDDEKKKRCETREDNEQEDHETKKRGKKRWLFGKHFSKETTIQHRVAKTAIGLCANGQENPVANEQLIKKEDSNVSCFDDQQKRAVAVAMAATAAAEAALANAVKIIHRNEDFVLAKRDEAAVVIQTIFRGYLARRALLALRGVVKMQALIRGHNVRKRAETTLKCMQSLVRIQSLVSDQRRRMSCDATTFSKNVSNTSHNMEIQALIQRAKQGKTLAHILSQQTWTLDEDQNSDKELRNNTNKWNQTTNPTLRKDRYLSIQRSIKTVEIDTHGSPNSLTPPKSSKSQNQDTYFIHSSSPKTPSRKPESPTSRSFYLHRTSLSENSCPLPRPSYMAATQSAMARVRPNSTPRQRPLSPNRQQMGPARRRLSFARGDGSVQFRDEPRSSVPCYLTE